ncbi:MAG: M14 family metallopeptidase [candidate division KSB1 bacterium]|nr:M14 family metallopeptidase [candidate division KSB1 bacterium]
MRICRILLLAGVILGGVVRPTWPGDPDRPHRVPLSFDRFYDYPELVEAFRTLERNYPKLLRLRTIGKSVQGRDLLLATIVNPDTGPERQKPAMYIEANVHGNEVQGAEVCLYTAWYLLEHYGKIPKVTELVDTRVFYIVPTVNPDGRAWWFEHPSTSSSSRSGLRPVDEDNDGLLDEDDFDDLDGDGHICQMRKRVAFGDYRVSSADPRLMERVEPGEVGDYILLGFEGVDNDGDGLLNEDGPGGYDPNRNWPADWQPNYVQPGSGDYPLSLPESRAVAQFLLEHPNIAGVQSYHNSGGMILRGPGAESIPEYPMADVRVYDRLGEVGETILPFYRYAVIYRDLYTVHGGFINWTYEGLGIFSFSNELWSSYEYFKKAPGREEGRDWRSSFFSRDAERMKFNDLVEMGSMFVEWHPYKHPAFGEIEIGGWKKWAWRVPPAFALEELCHRNCAFTLFHADQMPKAAIHEVTVEKMGPRLFRVRAVLANERIIPTMSQQAIRHKLHRPDRVSIAGPDLRVLAGGLVSDRWLGKMQPVERRPQEIRLEDGIPGMEERVVEWIVEGAGRAQITLDCVKGGVASRVVDLR